MTTYAESGMRHLEQVLAEAVPLVTTVTAKLQPARQDEVLRLVPFTRAVLYPDGSYELFEAQPLHVPTSADFAKIEEEGYAALGAMAEKHGLLLRPAFYLPKPHHALYIPAIEAYDGEHSVLTTIGRSYLALSFDPVPYLEGAPTKREGIRFSTDLRVGGTILDSQVRVERQVLGTGELIRFIASLR